MEHEIFVIILTAIIAGAIMITTIAKSIIGAVKKKSAAENSPSLTTSELERMLREVVGEATAPLQAKIESLEARLDAPRLNAASSKDDLPDLEDEEAVLVRRTRQQI
ncbi:MAG TPA: hypothetical protein VKP65_05365 [Rhodothermales bacterium]|nr:hypothetical protein [Rhodothermales bacterium]